MGDKLLLRLNIYGKPIANKYCEKRVKRLEIVEKEAVEIYSSAEVGGSRLTIACCQHC